MAQFIVLTVANNDVPELGQTGNAQVYRGDHADAASAVDAAADVFSLQSGQRLWVVSAASLTRFINTTTVSRSLAEG